MVKSFDNLVCVLGVVNKPVGQTSDKFVQTRTKRHTTHTVQVPFFVQSTKKGCFLFSKLDILGYRKC
jgi:hypothetical protein